MTNNDEANAPQPTLRFAGRRGKIKIEPVEGSTFKEVIQEAATALGFDFDPARSVILADGEQVDPDAAVDNVTKIDVAPRARLG